MWWFAVLCVWCCAELCGVYCAVLQPYIVLTCEAEMLHHGSTYTNTRCGSISPSSSSPSSSPFRYLQGLLEEGGGIGSLLTTWLFPGEKAEVSTLKKYESIGAGKPDVSSCRRATVLADWSPTCPSELELKQGEVVKVLKMSGGEEEEGWWDGLTDDGRTGQFPSTYVELLPAIPGPPPGRPGGGGTGGGAAAQGGAEEKSTLGMGGGRGAGGRVRSMSRANFATPPVVKMKKVRLETVAS